LTVVNLFVFIPQHSGLHKEIHMLFLLETDQNFLRRSTGSHVIPPTDVNKRMYFANKMK